MIGAKNSAAIAALELWWTGARVTLVHRGDGISELGEVLDQAEYRESHQERRNQGLLHSSRNARFVRSVHRRRDAGRET